MKWNFLYRITAASRTPDYGGYRPPDLCSLCPQMNLLNPPRTKFLGTPLLVSVVCCEAEVSSSRWSLVQRSPTECDVCECDREASIMRTPWPTRGRCAMVLKIRTLRFMSEGCKFAPEQRIWLQILSSSIATFPEESREQVDNFGWHPWRTESCQQSYEANADDVLQCGLHLYAFFIENFNSCCYCPPTAVSKETTWQFGNRDYSCWLSRDITCSKIHDF